MVARVATLMLFSAFAVGCGSGKFHLSPTPNVYADSTIDAFAGLPESQRTTEFDVVYFTNRAPLGKDDGSFAGDYGAVPSERANFGTARVEVADATWEEVEAAFRTSRRSREFVLEHGTRVEYGTFPPHPRSATGDRDAWDKEHARASLRLRELLESRLAENPVKEIHLFVHGFNTPFARGIDFAADVWLMQGCRGVPLSFSWPAGSGGVFGYFTDWDDGDAAAGDLARLLLLLRQVSNVEKVHVYGYSRGAHLVLAALHDLALLYAADDPERRNELRLANVVLLAPDVDTNYVTMRFLPVYGHRLPENFTIYTSKHDSIVGWARWLRQGRGRIGQIDWTTVRPETAADLENLVNTWIIESHVTDSDDPHAYYRRSPSVSSDLVLLIREGRDPGSEHGRPLARKGVGTVWVIRTGYPKQVEENAPEKKDREPAYE